LCLLLGVGELRTAYMDFVPSKLRTLYALIAGVDTKYDENFSYGQK